LGLCCDWKWRDEGAGYEELRPVMPLDVIPADAELLKFSNTSSKAGDVIPHKYAVPWYWWNMTELSSDPTPALGLRDRDPTHNRGAGPGVYMPGPTALYAYGYPYYWSANTHRERSNTATMLVLKDKAFLLYVMYIIDMAWDGSGGSLDLDVVATGSIVNSSGSAGRRLFVDDGRRLLGTGGTLADRARCERIYNASGWTAEATRAGNYMHPCLFDDSAGHDFLDRYRPVAAADADDQWDELENDLSLDTACHPPSDTNLCSLPVMWRDDPYNSYLYDSSTGLAFWSWHWLECCTDGIVLGPLPRNSLNPWAITFTQRCHKMEGLEQGTRIQNWHPYEQDFVHVDIPMHQSCAPNNVTSTHPHISQHPSYGGITIECLACPAYCDLYSNKSCGECTANLHCGWDDDTQTCKDATSTLTDFSTSYVPDQIKNSPAFTPLTTDSRVCSTCSSVATEYSCVTTAGCGWAHFEGVCCSGTPDYPSCPTRDGKFTVVQWEPPNQCYDFAYNEKKAFASVALMEKAMINPITSYPADHPKVADNVANDASRRRQLDYATYQGLAFTDSDSVTFTNVTAYNLNQPCAYIPGTLKMQCEDGRGTIPATDYWSKKGAQWGSNDPSIKPVTGAEAFYAYGYPRNYSSNTGNDRHNSIVSQLIVDTSGAVYMIVTVDKAYDGSGGDLVINMETAGITAGSPVVFFDDPQESTYTYNVSYQNGTFSFHWNDYAGDGFVFGPLPATDWSINMAVDRRYTQGLDSFVAGSYDSSKNDIDYVSTVPIKKAQAAWGGVSLSGSSCTGLCQALYALDCEGCMKDENCKFSASHGGCISQASYVYEFAHRDAYGVTTRCTGATAAPSMKIMKKNSTLFPSAATDNTVTVRIGAEGMDSRCPCSSLYGIFVAIYTWDMRLVSVAENIPVRTGHRFTYLDVPGLNNATYYNYYSYVCMMQGTVMRDDCSPAAMDEGRIYFE